MAISYQIITNSYKRSLLLVERSLAHSFKQSPPPCKVLFLDQNTDKMQVPSHPLLDHQQINSTCVSEARNKAVIPDNVEWIIFCDDDGYLEEGYAQKLQELIKENPLTEIFAGAIVRDDNGDFYSLRHKLGGDLNKFRNTKLLMGSNLVVKRETFLKLQKFDEQFGTGSFWGSGEETDFAWKAYFSKVPMRFSPELKVFHIPPYNDSLANSIKKAFRYGRGKGGLIGKWLIREKKIIVLIEFADALLSPFALSLISLIKLKPQMIAVYMGSLLGRIWGIALSIFQILKKN